MKKQMRSSRSFFLLCIALVLLVLGLAGLYVRYHEIAPGRTFLNALSGTGDAFPDALCRILGGPVIAYGLTAIGAWLLLWALLCAALPGRLFARAFDDVHTYLTLLIVSAVFVFPCLWLILASLSKSGSLYDFKGFFPAEYSLNTFIALFTDDVNGLYPYKQWFINTLYVSACSCVLGTVLVILTGYVMSRFRFKGRNAIKKTTLLLGMFPGFMGMTAIYIIMNQLKLVNQLEALIFLYAGTAPMGYLVQKGYFDTIPFTIHEAARIDGASNLKIFTKITLPLSKPMLVYTALTQFAWPWSDVLLPKLLLKTRANWTVAVGLFSMDETYFARFAAGSVFIAVPIVILYFCLVKYIVGGLTAGAVKG